VPARTCRRRRPLSAVIATLCPSFVGALRYDPRFVVSENAAPDRRGSATRDDGNVGDCGIAGFWPARKHERCANPGTGRDQSGCRWHLDRSLWQRCCRDPSLWRQGLRTGCMDQKPHGSGWKATSGRQQPRRHQEDNAARQANGAWDAGWIYNPEDGGTFSVELQLRSPDTLQVKGYAGLKFLSETYTWRRAPTNIALCKA
jgi:Uncharacterized protein conserved in bacteria (DUF2147)